MCCRSKCSIALEVFNMLHFFKKLFSLHVHSHEQMTEIGEYVDCRDEPYEDDF